MIRVQLLCSASSKMERGKVLFAVLVWVFLAFWSASAEVSPSDDRRTAILFNDFTPGTVVVWSFLAPERGTVTMELRNEDDIVLQIAIHYGVHPELSHVLSLNSITDGSQGTPQWHLDFPSTPGYKELTIVAHRTHFELTANRKRFTAIYNHRIPIASIEEICVSRVTGIGIRVGKVLSNFQPGKVIYIHGTAPHHNFGIRLYLNDAPYIRNNHTALIFLPRYDRNFVYRSSSYAGLSQRTEKHGGIPFVKGKPFSLAIVCQLYGYEIAVDGRHFTFYKHRVPIPETATVLITGELVKSVEKIQYF